MFWYDRDYGLVGERYGVVRGALRGRAKWLPTLRPIAEAKMGRTGIL